MPANRPSIGRGRRLDRLVLQQASLQPGFGQVLRHEQRHATDARLLGAKLTSSVSSIERGVILTLAVVPARPAARGRERQLRGMVGRAIAEDALGQRPLRGLHPGGRGDGRNRLRNSSARPAARRFAVGKDDDFAFLLRYVQSFKAGSGMVRGRLRIVGGRLIRRRRFASSVSVDSSAPFVEKLHGEQLPIIFGRHGPVADRPDRGVDRQASRRIDADAIQRLSLRTQRARGVERAYRARPCEGRLSPPRLLLEWIHWQPARAERRPDEAKGSDRAPERGRPHRRHRPAFRRRGIAARSARVSPVEATSANRAAGFCGRTISPCSSAGFDLNGRCVEGGQIALANAATVGQLDRSAFRCRLRA